MNNAGYNCIYIYIYTTVRKNCITSLLYVAVNRLGFPSRNGSSGWERSKACICVFSSTDNTKAFSEGFTYNPTLFSIFSSNSGSVLFTHQYSTLWGLRLWDFNIPCTVLWLMPSSLAILRWLQLEYPPFGFEQALLITRALSASV